MIFWLLFVIAFIWVVFAVVQDLKSREIANWLNFSLIIFALAIRFFYGVFTKEPWYFVFGLIGLGVFFLLGNLFYYSRFFAGGDAKLLIALGTIIPFSLDYRENIAISLIFLISLILLGGVYSLVYSVVLASKNKIKFIREFKSYSKKYETYLTYSVGFLLLMLIVFFFLLDLVWILLGIIVLLIPLSLIYSKSIESSCMYKYLDSKKVGVGEWLGENIRVRGKKIEGSWDGLSLEEVNFIHKNYRKKILIKQGIPFSPAFLMALIVIFVIYYFFNADWYLFFLFN